MRKYQQLVLLIISVVSICLVLIYRHEYLRLRYVMEVLNIFGTPPKKEDILAKPLHFSHWTPEPVWQRIDNHFYAYAAHRTDNTGEIKILGIGDKNIHILKLTCNLWYEDTPKPQLGKFSYTILTQGQFYTNYIFLCKQKQVKQVPYAVTISNSPLIFIKERDPYIKVPQMTVCVAPTRKLLETSHIVDFIAHNQVLGADNFIFYNNFITPKLRSALTYISSALNTSFTFFPWNIPNQKILNTNEIIRHDCLLRTVEQSNYVIILNMNEFIIPKYSASLLTILNTAENSKNMHRFTISVINFCKSLMPVKNILLHTRYIPRGSNSDELIVYRSVGNTTSSDTISSRSLDMDTVVLHRYINCSLKQETLSDSTAMNFAAHLNNAQLKILYDTGGLL